MFNLTKFSDDTCCLLQKKSIKRQTYDRRSGRSDVAEKISFLLRVFACCSTTTVWRKENNNYHMNFAILP